MKCLCIHVYVCVPACMCVCVRCSAVGKSNQPRGRSANKSRSEKDADTTVRSGCAEADGEIKAGRQTWSSTKTGWEMEKRASRQVDTQTGVTG